MKKILSITSLVLLLTACGGKQEKVENTVVEFTPPYNVEIPANIKPTVDGVFPLSEVASDVEFVRLEVTEESLLGGELRSVHVSDSHILVDDYQIICLYTRDGKFLTRIGKKGQGPEEYVFVVCALLDELRKEVHLLTKTGVKTYDFNGKFKRNVSLLSYELFANFEPQMYVWNKYIFLRDRISLTMPRKDIWTWALTDTSFQIKQKYYNSEITKRSKELNKQVGNVFGDIKWTEPLHPMVDFYDNDFTMCFFNGNTIFRFDTDSVNFQPLYRLAFEEKAPFEVASQWGKLDDRIWDYYILYDYTITKDYLYLLLSKEEDGIILRYNRKEGNTDYASFENKIKERKIKIADVVQKSMSIDEMFFRNDISGGCSFNVDYKSENGKYLVDIMSIDDIEANIDKEKLKKEKVKDEASKQRWIDLLNRLSDDEQIIAIATLK